MKDNNGQVTVGWILYKRLGSHIDLTLFALLKGRRPIGLGEVHVERRFQITANVAEILAHTPID